MLSDWTHVSYFSKNQFYEYLDTLAEDKHAREMEIYSKQQSLQILKDFMKEENDFYTFIKNYSPRDYKIIRKKQFVSQRVIMKHVQLWNEVHDTNIQTLNVFFL